MEPTHWQSGSRQTSDGRVCWGGQGQAVAGEETQLLEEVTQRELEQSRPGNMCGALSRVLKTPLLSPPERHAGPKRALALVHGA